MDAEWALVEPMIRQPSAAAVGAASPGSPWEKTF
jgi:hypothetical protein